MFIIICFIPLIFILLHKLCLISVSSCGPHPIIEDADVTELPGGKEIKVQCKKFYKLKGPETVSCVDGKWTALPVCKRES